jgi:hypothetical protein
MQILAPALRNVDTSWQREMRAVAQRCWPSWVTGLSQTRRWRLFLRGASSVFKLDAFFIRAATGPPRLGEGEPLIRWGKVPLFHDGCLAYYSE